MARAHGYLSASCPRDANGNITKGLREDGSCWYYDYDGLQRLTKAQWKTSGGSLLYGFQYGYDKVGNRTSLIINGEETCCYTYNPCNELNNPISSPCSAWGRPFRPLCGDRRRTRSVREQRPHAERRGERKGDGRGNQIRRTVQDGHTTYFAYDSRNLITAITSTDPAFTPNYFEYNARGQRIKKVDSTGTTRYVWDGLNIVLELDDAGDLKRRYTHGYAAIEGVASLIDVEDASAAHFFYHFDQVGGVRQLTDAYQNTAQAFEYEPFGRTLAQAGAAPNDFSFPATYVQLPELPTLRLSPTRVLDAITGRFLQRDALLRPPLQRHLPAGSRQQACQGREPLSAEPLPCIVSACRGPAAGPHASPNAQAVGAGNAAEQSIPKADLVNHAANKLLRLFSGKSLDLQDDLALVFRAASQLKRKTRLPGRRSLDEFPCYVDLDLYTYVTNQPLRAADPSGMGPPPMCEAYTIWCLMGDSYSCFAQLPCWLAGNNRVSNCIRDCLLGRYYPGKSFVDVNKDHVICYCLCIGRELVR